MSMIYKWLILFVSVLVGLGGEASDNIHNKFTSQVNDLINSYYDSLQESSNVVNTNKNFNCLQTFDIKLYKILINQKSIEHFVVDEVHILIDKIKYNISSGNVTEAKKLYDEIQGITKDYYNAISVARLIPVDEKSSAIRKTYIERSCYLLDYSFNKELVQTFSGETYELGKFFSDDTIWKDNSRNLTAKGWSPGAANALVNYKKDDAGQVMRAQLLSSCLPPTPTVTTDGKILPGGLQGNGQKEYLELQNAELATSLTDNWDDIYSTFGDYTPRFFNFIKNTQKTTGSYETTLTSLLTAAKWYKQLNPDVKDAALVSQVSAGYNNLCRIFTHDPDDDNQNPPSATQQNELNGIIYQTLEKLGKLDRPLDLLSSPEGYARVRDTAQVISDLTALGIDPYAQDGFVDDLAEYVAGERGSFVERWLLLGTKFRALCKSANTFKPNDKPSTVNPRKRAVLDVSEVLGGSSETPYYDNVLAGAIIGMKRYLYQEMRDGRDLGDIMETETMNSSTYGLEYNQLLNSMIEGIRERTGANQDPKSKDFPVEAVFATRVYAAMMDGAPFNLEAYAQDIALRDDTPVGRQIRDIYYNGTILAARFQQEFQRLKAHLMSPFGGNNNESTATALAMRAITQAEDIEGKGGDGIQYLRELRNTGYLCRKDEKKGWVKELIEDLSTAMETPYPYKEWQALSLAKQYEDYRTGIMKQQLLKYSESPKNSLPSFWVLGLTVILSSLISIVGTVLVIKKRVQK